MLKNIICTLLISISLLGLVGVRQTYAAPAAASPTGDIKSSQFMFDLGVVTHKDIKKKDWSKKGINFIFERAITIMAATIGGAAILVMVTGGLMIMFAGVHQDWREKGINMLKRAALGLFFVLGAYILVTTIQLLIKSIF